MTKTVRFVCNKMSFPLQCLIYINYSAAEIKQGSVFLLFLLVLCFMETISFWQRPNGTVSEW